MSSPTPDTAAVWVLSANAPDGQAITGVYASPEAAQRENPGEWERELDDEWIVKPPVTDSLYGGILERFDVIA